MATPEEKRLLQRAELQEKQRKERQALQEKQQAETKRRESREAIARADLEKTRNEQQLKQFNELKKQRDALQDKLKNAQGFNHLMRGLSGANNRDREAMQDCHNAMKTIQSAVKTDQQNLALEQGRAVQEEHERQQKQTTKLWGRQDEEMETLKREQRDRKRGYRLAQDEPVQDSPQPRPRPPLGMSHAKPSNPQPEKSDFEQKVKPIERSDELSLKRAWKEGNEQGFER